jgi:hypothetical protein
MNIELEVTLARLATEHWRLIQVLSRLIYRLPIESQDRVQAQVRFATNQLSTIVAAHDFQLATFEGRRFEPNLPVVAVNAHEFSNEARLLVSETLEPAVVANGRIIQLGKVTLSEEK